MRTDELVSAIRFAGKLSSIDPDWTDAQLLVEAYNVLMSAFVKPVVEARQGYWLKKYTYTLTSGKSRYRIPPRAVVGALEKVEVVDSAGNVQRLVMTSLERAAWYENQSGDPTRYTVQDDQVVTLPTAGSTNKLLRLSYYLRPSSLVAQQASTSAGLITAVDTTLRTITTATKPVDRTTTLAITNSTLIDVVHPNGSFGLPLVGATQAVSGAGPWTYTVAGTDSMSEIEVGDFIRAADQTDWPCLPLEFHTTLAEATAAMICTKKGDVQKAQSLAGKISSDVDRFIALACPRVKEASTILRSKYGIARARSRYRWPVAP